MSSLMSTVLHIPKARNRGKMTRVGLCGKRAYERLFVDSPELATCNACRELAGLPMFHQPWCSGGHKACDPCILPEVPTCEE